MDELLNEQPRDVMEYTLHNLQGVVLDDKESISPKEEPVSEPTLTKTGITINHDAIDIDREFDYEGYQVVRREFFAHTKEPAITFNNYKVYFNTACLRKFPLVDYVQALVNIDRKSLAIRPCHEEEHDTVPWCVPGSAQRKPRQITGKLFFANIFSLMGWNPDYRYKLLGKIVHAKDESLIAFDLSATEVYHRVFKDGERSKTSRTPVFPVGWQNQFGLPFKEHQKSMQIDIFNGYAVYAIKGNSVVPTTNTTTETMNHPLVDVADNDIAGGRDNEE